MTTEEKGSVPPTPAKTGELLAAAQPKAPPAGRLRTALVAGCRAGSVGAGIGLAVAALEQLAIALWAPGRVEATASERLAGGTLGASFFAISAVVAGSFGHYVGSFRSPSAARRGKIALATLAISSVALFHAFALGLRLLLGSSLLLFSAALLFGRRCFSNFGAPPFLLGLPLCFSLGAALGFDAALFLDLRPPSLLLGLALQFLGLGA